MKNWIPNNLFVEIGSGGGVDEAGGGRVEENVADTRGGPGIHGKEGRTSEVEKRSASPETGSIASRAKQMKRGKRVFLSKVGQPQINIFQGTT